MASADDSGIDDQNAPLELDSVGGEEEYDPAMASGLACTAPILRTCCTYGLEKNGLDAKSPQLKNDA